jgi:hypothetical protein
LFGLETAWEHGGDEGIGGVVVVEIKDAEKGWGGEKGKNWERENVLMIPGYGHLI